MSQPENCVQREQDEREGCQIYLKGELPVQVSARFSKGIQPHGLPFTESKDILCFPAKIVSASLLLCIRVRTKTCHTEHL